MAQLSVPQIFRTGAVLQRDTALPVWGTSAANTAVSVTLNDTLRTVESGADGRWRVELPAMPAGGPYTLMVTSGTQTLNYTNVFVGDVWLASGQSNMEWPLVSADGGAAAAAASNDPLFRQFKVTKGLANEPSNTLPSGSSWAPATPIFAGNFSAVAFYFGRALRAQRPGVPIGILNSSYGGSRIETWMTDEMLGFDESTVTLANGEAERQPTVAYNKMLHPIVGFPIKGIIWYQGESNADNIDDAADYAALFHTMIEGWRDLWGQGDVPFLWVQLPNFGPPQTPATLSVPPTWDAWPLLRDAQSSALTLPNTGEAITIDVGGEDIHPTNKEPVGERLALVARHVVYGDDVVASGPRFSGNRLRDDGSVVVAFDHIDGGLSAGGDGSVGGFTLAGGDGNYFWADGSIDGDSVVVSSASVSDPVTVRYAWAYNPADANLYNGAGLPAAPFEAPVDPGFSIGYFRTSRTTIEQGQSAVLSWQVYGADSVTLDGETIGSEGSTTVMPDSTTTYRLEAADSTGAKLEAEVTIEVLDPTAINRALGRPAVASTWETCCGDPRTPDFAVDGDPATRWSSAWQAGDANTDADSLYDGDPDDEWIQVDFGDVIDLDRVILSWEAAYGSEYDLELSWDGYLWRTVYEERSGNGGEDNIPFAEPPSGRFLRMHGLARATQYGYSLFEIAAYGSQSSVKVPSVSVQVAKGNVVPAGSTTTIVAEAEDADGTIAQVEFLVDGAAMGVDDSAPYELSWTAPGAGTYHVAAIATDNDGHAVQSDAFVVHAVDATSMTRYEAEDAARTGQTTIATASAASGGRYLEARDAWTLTFSNVTVPSAGRYLLSIGYQLTFESPKSQYLVVNGDTVDAIEFVAPDAAVWRTRGVVVDLRGGANEIAIHGWWNWMSFDYIEVSAQAVNTEIGSVDLPGGMRLRQNYPNPFDGSTQIGYELDTGGHVRLDVFDLTGRRVETLVDGLVPPGEHAVLFDGRRLASGTYVYRLETDAGSESRRMVLVR